MDQAKCFARPATRKIKNSAQALRFDAPEFDG